MGVTYPLQSIWLRPCIAHLFASFWQDPQNQILIFRKMMSTYVISFCVLSVKTEWDGCPWWLGWERWWPPWCFFLGRISHGCLVLSTEELRFSVGSLPSFSQKPLHSLCLIQSRMWMTGKPVVAWFTLKFWLVGSDPRDTMKLMSQENVASEVKV